LSVNQLVRSAIINGRTEMIPLGASYDDTLGIGSALDLHAHPGKKFIQLLVGASDSTAGKIEIEESDGDGVWYTIFFKEIVGGNVNVFQELKNTRRYIRYKNPGLDASTTTTLFLQLLY